MHLRSYLEASPRGEAARLSRALRESGVAAAPTRVSEWAAGARVPSAKAAVALEKETFGRVLREHMRPDWRALWPDLIPLRRIQDVETAAAA